MNLLYANDRAGRYPDSWYAATAKGIEDHARLKGAQRADVCVIGGGYTGLSAALHLAQRGYDVILLEAHRVGWGASGRNGGQVGTGQRRGQDELEQMVGRADAQKLWQIAEEAKALVKSLIAEHAIDCDWRPGLAYVELQKAGVAEAHAYADFMAERYGFDDMEKMDAAACAALLGTDRFLGGVMKRSSGHLHPLNYALGLARAARAAGVRIFERSEVTRLVQGDPAVAVTRHGKVTADHVVLACNGYLGGLDGGVAARVMPINNFIVATEPLGEDGARRLIAEDVAVADSKFVVNYWRRSADHRLIFGGGETYGWKFPRDIEGLVRKPMLQIYPHLRDVKVTHAWGGTLAITMNRMPCFRRIAGNILNASGYSGSGVALATMAGRVLANAVAGQAEQFDVMARVPTPRFPGGRAGRWPILALAMTWYGLRDRLGV